MSDNPSVREGSGERFDDPNRQAVGLDPAWVEGTGASTQPVPLQSLTKAELLDRARELGVTPANNDMTKAELIASIEAYDSSEGSSPEGE